MSQIKQLLRLYKDGHSRKPIARILSISKTTVRDYLRAVEHNQWSVDELLKLDDQELGKKFHGGSPSYKQDKYDYLKSRLDYYVSELKKTGVTKSLLWEEYYKENPDGYRRTQFCEHIKRYQNSLDPSLVLAHFPADQLQIDFAGRRLSYVDRTTGEVIECQVFVACLAYSDYCFAMAVPSQSSEDFIHALQSCLHDLGGVPKAIVPDNLKAAVTKSSRYEPAINRTLDDFANHYQTSIIPARARKPKDKARVENQVKIVYNRVYAKLRNELFFDISSLNEAIRQKVKLHNQTRMQGMNHCREEKFLAEEKPLLQALPETAFEIKQYKTHKVAQNNHIRLTEDKRYYSVPYQHIGKQAQVIYTKNTVSIYVEGKQVAVHIRHPKPGYSTTASHLCSTHQHYLKRSPDDYMEQARKRSVSLYELFSLIFAQNRHPEQLYNTCDGLLNLHRKSDPSSFLKACDLAMHYQNYSYGFIANILKNNMFENTNIEMENKNLPDHNNVRGKNYYS